MSGGRLPPSAGRLAEARRRGEVAVSPALVRAVAGLAAAVALVEAVERAGGLLVALARGAFAAAGAPAQAAVTTAASGELLAPLGHRAAHAAAALIGPVTVAALVAAVLVGLAQTGALFTFVPAARAAHRSEEGAGRSLVVAVGTILGAALALLPERAGARAAIGALAAADGGLAGGGAALLLAGARMLGRVALRLGVAAVALGVADHALRRIVWRRSLWMTRAEVERERREEEGDPRLRSERRRRHREVVAGLGESVAAADVIVVGAGLVVGLARSPREAAGPGLESSAERVAAGSVRRGLQRAIAASGGDPPDGLIITCVGHGLVANRLVALARAARVPVRTDESLARALATLSAGGPLGPEVAARARAHLAALAPR